MRNTCKHVNLSIESLQNGSLTLRYDVVAEVLFAVVEDFWHLVSSVWNVAQESERAHSRAHCIWRPDSWASPSDLSSPSITNMVFFIFLYSARLDEKKTTKTNRGMKSMAWSWAISELTVGWEHAVMMARLWPAVVTKAAASLAVATSFFLEVRIL